MNYEQKYKEDLEAAKGWLAIVKKDNNTTATQILESLFPELRESDDEKIRKSILELVKQSSHILNPMNQKSMIAWIEKQKEGNFIDKNLVKEEAHRIAWEYSKHYDPLLSKESWCEMAALDMAYWLEKQREKKPTEKVEPKFKIGDTVTVKTMSCRGKAFKGEPFRIVDIIEDNYVSDDGKTYSISLQDGWELVEQKPTWSEEDSKNLNSVKWIIETSENLNRVFETIDSPEYIKKYFIDWLDSLKDKAQPQQDWSEEDSKRLARIHQFIWANRKGDTDEIYQQEQDADWLMTLKPQPKQEWSKEDEDIINHLIKICSGAKNYNQFAGCSQNDITKYQNWLKSLKPNHWKPSEDQMFALRIHILENPNLESLYSELKKNFEL